MQIDLTKEEIEILLESIHGFKKCLEDWNMGDEYDVDTTPYTELENKIKGQIDWKSGHSK